MEKSWKRRSRLMLFLQTIEGVLYQVFMVVVWLQLESILSKDKCTTFKHLYGCVILLLVESLIKL